MCESYGLLFAWSPLGHYLRELLVKKSGIKLTFYEIKLLRQCFFVRTEHGKLLFRIIKFESGSV